MQTMPIAGLPLIFATEDQDTAKLVWQACDKSMRLLREGWGLDTPENCRIYVMSSWLGFVFRSAPWHWKILLAVTLPLWAYRARKTWSLAGGWQVRYGRRQAIGVKPLRLLQRADGSIGDRIFIKEANLGEKVQSITCHELTHACTSHLQLPAWLREGLAMLMVDRLFERRTVQPETLAVLKRSPDQQDPVGQQRLRIGDEAALVYLYARGYWLTRYIEETRPKLLRDLLAGRGQNAELESRVAAAYERRPDDFWAEIDGVLVSHFEQKGRAA